MRNKIFRILSIALCVAMLLSIAACGGDSSATLNTRKYAYGESVPDGDKTATKGFRVGYGRTEIMPKDSVPLDSYGNALQRMSTGFLNMIYFTCIAITDEEDNTLLLMTHDLTQSRTDILDELRQYAKNKYGVDPSYVHLSGTHTHSSVAIGSTVKSVTDYKVKYYQRAHEAIDMAMADRKTATLYAGETKTEGLNFVRNYYRADGTTAGDNYGYLSSSPVVAHVKEPDETMRLIKFCRTNSDGEKVKDVVLMNWQAHNHMTGSSTNTDLAADFSGSCREYMESQKDCYFAFFQGCAGNLNEMDTFFPQNNRTTDYREYGKLLAGYALDVYDKLEKMDTGLVKSETKDFEGPAIHRYDSLYNAAKEVLALYAASGNSLDAILPLCKQYGIQGNHHASCIIKNFSTAKTLTMPVNVYCIGDSVGFASAPVEFFDVLGEQMRAGSPFKLTFTQGYTDANTYGYMPSTDAYDYGCYESYNTKFEQGAGEMCVAQIIEMLKEIYD